MGKWRNRFFAERDRRYTEVGIEREKALKIKESADGRALELASEIQQYKDEKANDLRSQIERERGTYVTHEQLASQSERTAQSIRWLIGLLVTLLLAAVGVYLRKG